MPSVRAQFGSSRISEAQLRRLYAIALGSLGGSKREKLTQLNEMIEDMGYSWDAVDQDGNPSEWLTTADYDELVKQLEAIGGGL